ncbi:mucosa-associated lymphoid tissue lymphoma translocation protein 1-like [Neodiprion virginianus]|uniref:mucosa-associated lymphoid tissue lymphoma translocation protein 1-like n=1 Tax=Neodiprion virginianus TaxID=2961670 RepID=UPI001EE6973C|nr:mucosa-associated lymphoid tissue lymphoma translocation protein 1-like [Neodiprion virginianus]
MYDEDLPLEELDYDVLSELTKELNKNFAWKTVANYLVEESSIQNPSSTFSKRWMYRLETNREASPAQTLLLELSNRLYRVGKLCHILEDCELYDALCILLGPVDLEITEQPNAKEQSYKLALNDTFKIVCKARGIPVPMLQWRHGNIDLENETSSTLSILITSPDQEGEYRCRVEQRTSDGICLREKYSEYVSLSIKAMPPEITEHPLPAEVKIGEDHTLSCQVKPDPSLKYQWYKDDKLLKGKTQNTLRLLNFQFEDTGRYRCEVSNGYGLASFTACSKLTVEHLPEKALYKVALLIGNCQYKSYSELNKPVADVEEIKKKLETIGFYVTCLRNASLAKMTEKIQKFSKSLKEGVYGFFMFAGHGFELHEPFLMPTDIPEQYLRRHAISRNQILQWTLPRNPALLVVVLDMCLTTPNKDSNKAIYDEIPEVFEYKCNDNLIEAYSTCTYRECFESEKAPFGVYVTELTKHITEKIPVKELFDRVQSSVRQFNSGRTRKQMPMVKNVLSKRYCLTDQTIRRYR